VKKNLNLRPKKIKLNLGQLMGAKKCCEKKFKSTLGSTYFYCTEKREFFLDKIVAQIFCRMLQNIILQSF